MARHKKADWSALHAIAWEERQKIMVPYKSASILSTDIANVSDWGCGGDMEREAGVFYGKGLPKPKRWWVHPSLEFQKPQSLVHVRLKQIGSLNASECRPYWDAYYDLKGGSVLCVFSFFHGRCRHLSLWCLYRTRTCTPDDPRTRARSELAYIISSANFYWAIAMSLVR